MSKKKMPAFQSDEVLMKHSDRIMQLFSTCERSSQGEHDEIDWDSFENEEEEEEWEEDEDESFVEEDDTEEDTTDTLEVFKDKNQAEKREVLSYHFSKDFLDYFKVAYTKRFEEVKKLGLAFFNYKETVESEELMKSRSYSNTGNSIKILSSDLHKTQNLARELFMMSSSNPNVTVSNSNLTLNGVKLPFSTMSLGHNSSINNDTTIQIPNPLQKMIDRNISMRMKVRCIEYDIEAEGSACQEIMNCFDKNELQSIMPQFDKKDVRNIHSVMPSPVSKVESFPTFEILSSDEEIEIKNSSKSVNISNSKPIEYSRFTKTNTQKRTQIENGEITTSNKKLKTKKVTIKECDKENVKSTKVVDQNSSEKCKEGKITFEDISITLSDSDDEVSFVRFTQIKTEIQQNENEVQSKPRVGKVQSKLKHTSQKSQPLSVVNVEDGIDGGKLLAKKSKIPSVNQTPNVFTQSKTLKNKTNLKSNSTRQISKESSNEGIDDQQLSGKAQTPSLQETSNASKFDKIIKKRERRKLLQSKLKEIKEIADSDDSSIHESNPKLVGQIVQKSKIPSLNQKLIADKSPTEEKDVQPEKKSNYDSDDEHFFTRKIDKKIKQRSKLPGFNQSVQTIIQSSSIIEKAVNQKTNLTMDFSSMRLATTTYSESFYSQPKSAQQKKVLQVFGSEDDSD